MLLQKQPLILTNQFSWLTCTSQSDCRKYKVKKSFCGEILQNLLLKFPLFQIKMDEFNYLKFLNDDNDLLAAEQLLADGFPTFDVSFNQMIADFSLNIAALSNCLESTGIKTKTTTTATKHDEAADLSRFPVVSNKDIKKLKSVAVNKNTSRLTKQWMNVFNLWCSSRHLNINIETMVPEEFDKVLSKIYAEVKKKDGDGYEPESLKIMQSSTERYLKEKGYPVSIVSQGSFTTL